jgi:hypothetical protein
MMWQPPIPPQPPVQVFVPVAFTEPARPRYVRLVKEDGKARVEVSGDAGSMRAIKMTIEEGACGRMHLSAGTRHLHIKGRDWAAQADKAEISPGGTITLRGHVKLTSGKLGDSVSITGHKVVFTVKDGHFDKLVAKECSSSSDPNRRTLRLMNQSNDLRRIHKELKEFWMIDQPSHLTDERVHGGVAPN